MKRIKFSGLWNISPKPDKKISLWELVNLVNFVVPTDDVAKIFLKTLELATEFKKDGEIGGWLH